MPEERGFRRREKCEEGQCNKANIYSIYKEKQEELSIKEERN